MIGPRLRERFLVVAFGFSEDVGAILAELTKVGAMDPQGIFFSGVDPCHCQELPPEGPVLPVLPQAVPADDDDDDDAEVFEEHGDAFAKTMRRFHDVCKMAVPQVDFCSRCTCFCNSW